MFLHNHIGTLSPNFGPLNYLNSLQISNSAISGPIPYGLFQSTSISIFDLSHNQLTGIINEITVVI